MGSNGPNPHANAAPLLKQAYAELMEHFYRNLVKQTHYDGYFRSMKESNLLEALKYLQGNMLSPEIGQEESVSRLRELVSLMKGGKISLASSEKQMHELIALLTVAGWGDASPELVSLLRHEVIEETELLSFSKDRNLVGGSDGDDEMNGTRGNDVLRGAFGNDKLYGQDGDDVLVGGTGDDHLVGGYGSDTYMYNKGDGHDTIDNSTYYYDHQGKDRLKFGDGISSEDLELIRRGNDVTFSLKDGTGSVLLQNWYAGGSHKKLDEVEFSDGTKWSTEDVESRAVAYEPGTNAAASAEPASAPAAPEAFSAVSPSSAMSESEAGVLSETEAEESLAVLSTPSFMSARDNDNLDSLGGGTSLASAQ